MVRRDADTSDDENATLGIACDVDCQFDLFVASKYSGAERASLGYAEVTPPTEWFEAWLEELTAI